MNPRRIAVAVFGSTFFTLVYEAGVYAVPGPMEALPTVAGIVAPPLVAVLWLGVMTGYNGDDAVIRPYVPPAQRKALPPARPKALEHTGARHG